MSRGMCLFVALVTIAIPVHPQGWSDYSYEIGDGFMVFRGNHIDIGIVSPDGSVITILFDRMPENSSDEAFERYIVGRKDYTLRNYMVTDRYIFVRCGQEKASPQANAVWPTAPHFADSSYIVIDKRGWAMFRDEQEYVFGPMSLTEFLENPAVVSAGSIEWLAPRNPNANLLRTIRWAIYFVFLIPVYLLLRIIVVSLFGLLTQGKQKTMPEEQQRD